ncbi:hypothetical protein V2J09_019585 [Rumex salicifolius]
MSVKNTYNMAFATALASLVCVSRGAPQVSCLFIFGDSLSDSGNNNILASMAKANFLPYGVDFPEGPTGRFTNGRTAVDLVGNQPPFTCLQQVYGAWMKCCSIGDHLGLEGYILPFPSASAEDAVKGVNYASGSAGILDETGIPVGERIPMSQQLMNHQTTISKITDILGENKVNAHLNKCLYWVYAGSNDYMLNYFTYKATTMTPEQFTELIFPLYTQQLKSFVHKKMQNKKNQTLTLYDYGARKVVVMGLMPLGCMPLLKMAGGCSDYVNNVLDQMFNRQIKSLVDEFNHNLTGAQFIFVDTMRIMSPDLSALGLTVLDTPCCGCNELWCVPYTATVCLDRDDYAYWDLAHPTEAANKVLAARAYSARDAKDAYPMDIKHLVTSKANTMRSQVRSTDSKNMRMEKKDGMYINTDKNNSSFIFG